MDLMDAKEKQHYTGFWFTYDDSMLLEKGDLVMYETLSGIEVSTIDRVGCSGNKYAFKAEDSQYWHSNGYIIPRSQIIAYKPKP